MRIPWYLVALIATAVFGGGLWFGARNTDFTVAPDDRAVAESVKRWKKKHPPRTPQERASLPLPSTQPITVIKDQTKGTVIPQIPQIPLIPLGNLDSIPSLEHYREHGDCEAPSFIQLATQLESSGNLNHAMLAWERVFDTTDSNAEQSLQARTAISALRSTQPIWNTDTEDNFDLILHIHSPAEHKTQISALLGQLSDDIRDASSHQVAPQTLIKTTPQRDGYPSPPIRVWLSSTGEETKETPQLTLQLNEGEAPLDEQLYMAIYRSISGQLQQSADLMPPAALSTSETPRESLTTNLTRLHWKKLCESLHVEQKQAPPAVIIIEESNE